MDERGEWNGVLEKRAWLFGWNSEQEDFTLQHFVEGLTCIISVLHITNNDSYPENYVTKCIPGWSRVDPHCVASYYKSIEQPRLKCCLPFWSPHLENYIVELEKVQKTAIKIIKELEQSHFKKEGCSVCAFLV